MSRRIVLSLALLSWLVLGVVHAQDGAASPPGADADAAAPAAIAVAEIPDRADADERFAQDSVALALAPDPAIALGRRLDVLQQAVEEKTRLFRFDELKMLPAPRLESLERYWKFDQRRALALHADLREASAPYAAAAAGLAKRRADWEATRIAAAEAGLAAALVERIDAVVVQLRRAEDLLAERLAGLLRLGRRANAVDAEIDAGLMSIDAAINFSDRRLLRFDTPPLWSTASAPADNTDPLASTRLGLSIESGFASQYANSGFGNRQVLAALQLLLLPLLAWLSIRSRKSPQAGVGGDTARRTLQRPFSAWLLLSMMGVLVFEPDAPLLVHQLAMALALVPVLRLLPPASRNVLGPWPYVATGLYLLNRLAFLLLSNAVLYRWYILALTVLALVLTAWLLWRSRHLEASGLSGRIGRLVHAAAWVGVGVLAVSAIANMAGNLTLAEMLTGGLIDSGYTGLLLFAGVTVFNALLALLLGQRDVARLRIVREHAAPMLHVLHRLLVAAAAVGWLVYTANRFRVFRPIQDTVASLLTSTFSLGEISLTLGSVLVFAGSVLVAFWVARGVRFLLREEVLPNMSLPRGVDNSIASLSYYALLMLGLLLALAAAGFQVGQLALVFGALGVGIGLGLQDVVKNFVSGLILMFERPMKPGDVVEITGTSGRVRDIGMRATTIRTFEGADVVVPNGTLLSEKLANWTLLDMHRRLELNVGVAYGSDPEQVRAVLLPVVRSIPGVASEPGPDVLFSGFGASALEFSIRAWTHDYENWVETRSMLAMRVYTALRQAGIEIPFAQRDLHLRSMSDGVAAALARRDAPAPASTPETDAVPREP